MPITRIQLRILASFGVVEATTESTEQLVERANAALDADKSTKR